MISYIEVDGTRTTFVNNKPNFPTTRKRLPKRQLSAQEDILECRLRQKLAYRRFIPELSVGFNYFNNIFKNNLPNAFAVGLGLFFSHMLNIPFPREYYRRKSTTLYWLSIHIGSIRAYTSSHVVKVNYNIQDYQLK